MQFNTIHTWHISNSRQKRSTTTTMVAAAKAVEEWRSSYPSHPISIRKSPSGRPKEEHPRRRTTMRKKARTTRRRRSTKRRVRSKHQPDRRITPTQTSINLRNKLYLSFSKRIETFNKFYRRKHRENERDAKRKREIEEKIKVWNFDEEKTRFLPSLFNLTIFHKF